VTDAAQGRKGGEMIVSLRVALVSIAALLVFGCGGDDSSARAGGGYDDGGGGGGAPPVACTEIGCDSGVFLDLAPLKRGLPAAERLKLCLRDKCNTYSLSRVDLVNLSVKGLREGQRVSVRMVVYGDRGKVLRRSAVRAPVRKVQPNGPKCPPTCFQVPVRIDRETLRLEVTR
jgi:hypothetical protein